jgi:hypothetical protein
MIYIYYSSRVSSSHVRLCVLFFLRATPRYGVGIALLVRLFVHWSISNTADQLQSATQSLRIGIPRLPPVGAPLKKGAHIMISLFNLFPEIHGNCRITCRSAAAGSRPLYWLVMLHPDYSLEGEVNNSP